MTLKLLTSAKDYFLELIFPIKCVVCSKETERARKNKLICTDCLKELTPSLNFYCPLCEARSIGGEVCFSCSLVNSQKKILPGEGSPLRYEIISWGNRLVLDRLLSPFSYKEAGIQKIIRAFKYHYIKKLQSPIGKMLEKYLEKITGEIDLNGSLVVPVPLHKRKFFQRGYNQAQLLAEQIAKYLNVEILNNCLIKTKSTKDQVDLEKEQRVKNLEGVFKCLNLELIKNRKVLLVDDVYTSGTTMNECAKVLKEAGAKEVIGLVIARG